MSEDFRIFNMDERKTVKEAISKNSRSDEGKWKLSLKKDLRHMEMDNSSKMK
jgi:hypothetical protein